MTDEALWTGVRALQAKEAILRRLAEQQAKTSPGSEAAALADAERANTFIERMRTVVTGAPLARSDTDSDGMHE